MASNQALRVMLIDDNDLIRSVLRMSMQDERFVVVGEAASARAGLAGVRRLNPDLVFLDIVMADSEGLGLLEQLRRDHAHIRVWMVTASTDHETLSNAMALGASGFVYKPFNAAKIQQALDCAYEECLHAPR